MTSTYAIRIAGLLLALAAAAPRPAGGATPPPSVQTLVDEALARSPRVAAARARAEAALERVPQARSLPDPKLMVGVFLAEVETRVGPQRARVGLSQRFPWFGKRGLAGDIAAADAAAAGERLAGVERELARSVREAYAELWYLERAVAWTDDQLALLDELESVLSTRYRAGAAAFAELIKIRVERGRMAERRADLEDRRRPATARLNAVLGRAIDSPPFPLPPLPALALAQPADTLLARIAASDPTLRAAAAELRGADDGIALARKQGLPDFSLGLEYMDTGPARMPGVADSGKDPLALTLSLDLPLWRGRVAAGEREAAARKRARAAGLHDRTLGRSAELEQALFDYREARRRSALYADELLPEARQGYAVGLEAFRAEKLAFETLVDARRLLDALELDLARSRADVFRHLAAVEAIAGPAALRTLEIGGER